MKYSLLFFTGLIIFAIFKHFKNQADNKRSSEELEIKRRNHLKKLIEERNEREELAEFDSVKFWKLIEETRYRSNNNYKNQLGLIRDYLIKLSPEELIKLDNTYVRLIVDANTWDLYGASTIIFKNPNFDYLELLINWIITRGEIFYNNSLVNTNIITNKDFIELEGRTIANLIEEVYARKTQELIPSRPNKKIELSGEQWEEKDLPSRFSELWYKYA